MYDTTDISQVCPDCAIKAGGHMQGIGTTMWMAKCDICHVEKGVTSPRDLGSPEFNINRKED